MNPVTSCSCIRNGGVRHPRLLRKVGLAATGCKINLSLTCSSHSILAGPRGKCCLGVARYFHPGFLKGSCTFDAASLHADCCRPM